jgi:hypothetical protein
MNNKLSVSINEYLGKVEEGVIVTLSFVFEDEYYEGTIFYNSENFLITIPDELESKIGMDIKEYSEYTNIVTKLLKLLIPYDEIVNRIDYIDLDKVMPLEDGEE